MRDKTEVTREYMRDPGLWPHWPILPMRRSSKGLDGEHGVIVCNNGHGNRTLLRIYKVDMFTFAECKGDQVLNLPVEDFPSVDGLLKAGWLVD